MSEEFCPNAVLRLSLKVLAIIVFFIHLIYVVIYSLMQNRVARGSGMHMNTSVHLNVPGLVLLMYFPGK